MKPIIKPKGSERGSVLVEFAISWTVLIAVVSGVYQFGYSFFLYNQLMTSVTNAATLGAKMDYDTGDPDLYTSALTNMVLYGSTTAGSKTLVPNLTSANVNISTTLSGTIPVAVTISITGYQVDTLFKKFTFTGKPRATFAYMGHIVCASC